MIKFIGAMLDDMFMFFGIFCVTRGVAMIYEPAGIIALGVLMMFYAVLIARAKGR